MSILKAMSILVKSQFISKANSKWILIKLSWFRLEFELSKFGLVDKILGLKLKHLLNFHICNPIVVLYNQKSMGIKLHDENLFTTKKMLWEEQALIKNFTWWPLQKPRPKYDNI